MKTCSRCLRTLDSSCFIKSDRYLDGLTQPCKECRREKQKLRLEANPTCIMCKKEPHMKGNYYCKICLRIINDLPIERKRPNVDRNNKTMCCSCKVKPRRTGGHYCIECANEMCREWNKENWKEYLGRGINRQKHNARVFVYRQVKAGKMTKLPCAVCGNPNVQGHHHNGYDRPNWGVVTWLCYTHHRDADKKQNIDNLGRLI